MQNLIALCFSVLSLSLVTGVYSHAEPSSEIPARREFPPNPDIAPCVNFYEHACSKVNASFKLRDDRSGHTFAFSDSHERILESKKKFFLAPPEKLSQRGNELVDFYTACMNEGASKGEELVFVKKILDEVAALPDHAAFQSFVGDRILSEDTSLVGFNTIANVDNALKYDAFLLSDLQSLPERSYYQDRPEVVAALKTLMTDFFKTIELSEPEARAERLVAFEKDFSKTYPLPAEFRDLFSKRTGITRADLLKQYPNLKFESFLAGIPGGAHLRHLTPDNFAWLNKALETTPLETLKDLYRWQAASPLMDDAYPEYFQKKFDFNHKYLGGPEKRSDRQERCTKRVMSRFGKELDAELVGILFPDFPEKKLVAMTEKIREAIMQGLRKNKWLSPKARVAAIQKIKTARLQLVKPKTDAEWDFMPRADYSNDKPITNDRTVRRMSLQKDLAELRAPRNPDVWHMSPLTVNAYYSSADNKFVLPIGILQYPFYDGTLPEWTNLGAAGVVIGHELGHSIDDKGSRFDHNGRLRAWMTDADVKTFQARGKKLIAQFEAVKHNGTLTLGENIGDLVGVTFGLAAIQKNDPQKTRDFFYQYARLWCNVTRPVAEEVHLKTDPHSLGKERVNQQVRQQPAFAEAFACKKGDPMTLSDQDRVVIW